MAFYQPSGHIQKLLEERVKAGYAKEISNGVSYHINYSLERGQTKAVVNFYSGNSSYPASAIYELKTDSRGDYYWYMARDWND